jgi:hypothetical protein
VHAPRDQAGYFATVFDEVTTTADAGGEWLSSFALVTDGR